MNYFALPEVRIKLGYIVPGNVRAEHAMTASEARARWGFGRVPAVRKNRTEQNRTEERRGLGMIRSSDSFFCGEFILFSVCVYFFV